MVWKHWLRNSFIAGLVIVAPMVITIVALQVLFGWMTALVNPLVQATDLLSLTGNNELVAQLLALALVIGFIIFAGFITQWGVGERLFGGVDRAFNFLPFVSVIYTSVRQVSESLMSSQSRFESVVLVEYPRKGIHSLGFVTNDSPDPVQTETGKAYNVYFPNSPNPTNGLLVMVPEEEITEIDMSPRRGIRLLVTTGMAETKADIDQLEKDVDADLHELKFDDEAEAVEELERRD